KPKPEAWRAGQRAAGQPLLDLDLGARFLELFLDARGLVLADAFLDGLGRAVNQVLGFLEAKAGDFANCLDDVDLVAADVSENNGEFRLLFRRSRRGSRAARGRDHGGRSSRNAEGFFHFLDQVGRFKKRQALDFFQDRFDFRHDCDFSSQFSEQNFRNRGGRGPLSPKPLRTKLFGLDRFADGHGEITGQRVERGRDPLSRSVQEEHDLADQLILGRHGSELLDLRDGNHSAFHHAGLELERRNFLGDLGEGLGEGHRVGTGVGDGVGALQVLEHALSGCAGAGKFRESVFDNLIFAAGGLHGAAELGVVFDGDALEGGENHGGHLRELGFQLVQILLLFAFLLHYYSRSPLISLRATRRLPASRPRRYRRGCPDPWSKSG